MNVLEITKIDFLCQKGVNVNKTQKKTQSGFSLIELIIVVAIIAIITSIAYPSYIENVVRGRRADTKAILLENAQFMERYFTENGSYKNNISGTPVSLPASTSTVPRGAAGAKIDYTITLDNLKQDTYRLVATRANNMASDACNDFTLTNLGVKGTVAAPTQSKTVDECWRK